VQLNSDLKLIIYFESTRLQNQGIEP